MFISLLLTQSTTVISRQLSNIPTHGLLSKCKNNLILPTDQSKSPKKTIKALSWNYSEITEEEILNQFFNLDFHYRNEILFFGFYRCVNSGESLTN